MFDGLRVSLRRVVFSCGSSVVSCPVELLTIIVALQLWGSRWSGLRLTVCCDNQVAVTVLHTGRCRSSFLNSYLREVRVVHVPCVSNRYADLLSRWDSNDVDGRHQF